MPKAPSVGAPPGIDPAQTAERDRVANEERARRIAGSRGATNPLGGIGDTTTPNLAAKSLLGV